MSGQTLTDRIAAAQYSLTGSDVARVVCKATTHEQTAPKKKHLECELSIHLSIYLYRSVYGIICPFNPPIHPPHVHLGHALPPTSIPPGCVNVLAVGGISHSVCSHAHAVTQTQTHILPEESTTIIQTLTEQPITLLQEGFLPPPCRAGVEPERRYRVLKQGNPTDWRPADKWIIKRGFVAGPFSLTRVPCDITNVPLQQCSTDVFFSLGAIC